jgi:POT family proton-dependent oligopeptide transporter
MQLSAGEHVNMMGLPVTWQAAMNPVLIILLAGVLAMVWQRVNVSASAKFTAGLLLCGVSVLLLSVAAARAVGDVRVLPAVAGRPVLPADPRWTVPQPHRPLLSHKLAPAGMGSQLAGLFFLSASAGDVIGGQVASRLDGVSLYSTLGTLAVLVGIGMALATPRIRALIES